MDGTDIIMYSGPIGSNPFYEKSIKEGKLVSDPSTFDFDKELSKPTPVSSKYQQLYEFKNWSIRMSLKNGDKFLIVNTIEEETNPEYKPKKIYCYECLNVHKIGKFIVFPGWDYIVYFNTKTQKVKTQSIR